MMDCVTYINIMNHWPINPNKVLKVHRKRLNKQFRFVEDHIICDNRDIPEKKEKKDAN
jgi:hypothetical protein